MANAFDNHQQRAMAVMAHTIGAHCSHVVRWVTRYKFSRYSLEPKVFIYGPNPIYCAYSEEKKSS